MFTPRGRRLKRGGRGHCAGRSDEERPRTGRRERQAVGMPRVQPHQQVCYLSSIIADRWHGGCTVLLCLYGWGIQYMKTKLIAMELNPPVRGPGSWHRAQDSPLQQLFLFALLFASCCPMSVLSTFFDPIRCNFAVSCTSRHTKYSIL